MSENRPPGEKRPSPKAPGARSVRRNLFNRDPDQPFDDLTRECKELSRRQEMNFREQWNYDIANDMPLPGKYEWSSAIPLTTSGPLLAVPSAEVFTCATTAGSAQAHQSPTDSAIKVTHTYSDDGACSSSQCSNGYSNSPLPKKRKSSSSGKTVLF